MLGRPSKKELRIENFYLGSGLTPCRLKNTTQQPTRNAVDLDDEVNEVGLGDVASGSFTFPRLLLLYSF